MDSNESLKSRIIDLLDSQLSNEMEGLLNAVNIEINNMQDSPNAMQSWSDTTRSQKEDLINGLNKQLIIKKKLWEEVKSLNSIVCNKVENGALVSIQENDKQIYFFIYPSGGSSKLIVEENTIFLISPSSIVGKAFLSHKVGDLIKVATPSGTKEYRIISVE